ncbi:MAG: dUTP diphosphatase [Verrucomicrobiota bacterium]|nr:dUTP diphosphatase [Verrucomicrobiota bacterium]
MTITVRFKMMDGCNDLVPAKQHPGDAAYDLKSREDIELVPKYPQLVGTGVFLELPDMHEAQIRPRSGLACKSAITILNTPGTIDSGYRGEVKIILFNAGKESFHIKRGERIAQIVVNRLPEVLLEQVEALSDSSRGSGGFGSTGKR